MHIIDSWMSLPLDIFKLIHMKARSKRLSEVDKALYKICSSVTGSLRLCPPRLIQGSYPEDILVELIKRYPDIRTLAIGKRKRGFGASEEVHIRAFAVFLKQYPLDHLSHLMVREIEGTGPDESKQINQMLLESLSNSNLSSVSIQILFETSVLSGIEIQPILEKSINLKKFKLNCRHANEHPSIALTFAKQPHLISAEFIEFCEPLETLQSIRSCQNLKIMRLTNAHNSTQIKQMLASDSSKNLKRLSLSGITVSSNEELSGITKANPNLDHLNITLNNITENGLKVIGQNCSKLRSLILSYQNVTDHDLDLLFSQLPSLEELTICKGYQITGPGVAAIAQNCLKLRQLKLFRIKGLDRDSVESIASHINLEHLEICHSGTIAYEELQHLAKNLKNLKVFKFTNIAGITEEDKAKLKIEFPLFF